MVVDAGEGVELVLEFGDGPGAWLGAEPSFEGLLEAFDLAAGGGVVGPGVLLGDLETGEFGLEAVASASSAGEVGGEHQAVVGEDRGRKTVVVAGGAERVDHCTAVDGLVGGDGQGVAGVVVEPRQDLDVGAVGEPPVGEVRLPALVGEDRFEPDVGGLRSLLRVRLNEAGLDQPPADRGHRHGDLVVVLEVPADRDRPGVEAFSGQRSPEVHDQRGDVVADLFPGVDRPS